MSATDPLAGLARLEGVPSAMTAARDAVDVALRDRGRRRTGPDETTDSLLRGAWCSAVLDGSGTRWADVRSTDVDPLLRDAVRLSTALLSVLGTLDTQPRQALARLHVLAVGGAVPAEQRGRPRDAESALRLSGVADLLRLPTEAPAMVAAAVVHAEIATTAPFGSRDGLVARGAERLVLVSRGVDPASVVVPEAGHLSQGPDVYRAALDGYASGTRVGVHAWLLHCAQAYAAAAGHSPLAGDLTLDEPEAPDHSGASVHT